MQILWLFDHDKSTLFSFQVLKELDLCVYFVYITFTFEYYNKYICFPSSPPLFFFFRRSRSWWTHAAPASTPHAFASSETTSSRNSCVYDIPRAPTSSPTPLADILKSELFARFFLHILISEFFALFLIFSLYFKFFLLRSLWFHLFILIIEYQFRLPFIELYCII